MSEIINIAGCTAWDKVDFLFLYEMSNIIVRVFTINRVNWTFSWTFFKTYSPKCLKHLMHCIGISPSAFIPNSTKPTHITDGMYLKMVFRCFIISRQRFAKLSKQYFRNCLWILVRWIIHFHIVVEICLFYKCCCVYKSFKVRWSSYIYLNHRFR